MRRSVSMLLVGTEIGLLSWWLLGLQFETGLDALQYHRMANAIVQHGLAPWTVNPLSYIGIYPGSDSSGVPFLAASVSLLSGTTVTATVLIYDAVLILVLGLGLFALTRRLTNRTDLAFLAIVMGTLAFGFFTTLSWSLDERSFNVALAPMFLLLALPRRTTIWLSRSAPKLVALGLVSLVMFVSHLNFLLLVPFLVVGPLMYQVTYHQYAARRKRRTSIAYFGAIGLSPLILLATLNQFGVLGNYALEYGLESSALFSGNSPIIFLINALIFLGTRAGPVNLAFALVGLLYLATRPRLFQRDILLGCLLLAGFLGLPVVTYSKDLLTPILVVFGLTALHGIGAKSARHRTLVFVLAGIVVLSGSVAFDAWNSARTFKAAEVRYWSPPGVTPEMQDGNLWIRLENPSRGCAYGNNPAMLQQVTNEPGLPLCTGVAIDVAINEGASSQGGTPPFRVSFVGINGVNPSNWFTSPELNKAADDFARLPSMTFQAGRALLSKYGVSVIVVDLQKQNETPTYDYQGAQSSIFFTDLWNSLYPIYRSGNVAVFMIR